MRLHHDKTGGAGGGSKAILPFTGSGGTLPTGATRYLGVALMAGTESRCQLPIPFDATIKNLYASSHVAPGAGQTYTVTIRINGANGTLTCAIADAGIIASDLVNSDSVTAGNLINFIVVSSAGATNATYINVTIEVESV